MTEGIAHERWIEACGQAAFVGIDLSCLHCYEMLPFGCCRSQKSDMVGSESVVEERGSEESCKSEV